MTNMMSKIVAAVTYRDYVLVFTDVGDIYRIDHDPERNDIKIQRLAAIPHK